MHVVDGSVSSYGEASQFGGVQVRSVPEISS